MFFTKIIKDYWKSMIIISSILYLSFAPPTSFKAIPTFENEDKLIHILMYLGLSAILIFDFKHSDSDKKSVFTSILICLILPILLGGAVELAQGSLFPPRTASWLDWLADIIGVLIAWLGMIILKKTTKISI